jgi:hypothetical protein
MLTTADGLFNGNLPMFLEVFKLLMFLENQPMARYS